MTIRLSEVPEGSRVRVVLEGTFRRITTGYGTRRVIDTGDVRVPLYPYAIDRLDVEILAPSWQEGDVVEYAGATFVRTAKEWLGSNGWKAADSEINARHEIGQVTHLLRNGKAVV